MNDSGVVFAAARVTAACWREMYDGREFLIAPVVALVPGVLNRELVLAEEIGKHVGAWNDSPVPVGHPKANGVPVSARRLDTLPLSIGRFQNVVFTKYLAGEVWFDLERAASLGYGDLLAGIESGELAEVSTAYYRDVEEAPGEWEGTPYDTISRNIRPDHLAVLPGDVGACSLADGCGLPRANAAELIVHGGSMAKTAQLKYIVTYELSLDGRRDLVFSAFLAKFVNLPSQFGGEVWVREIFDDRVIAAVNGALFAVPYTIADDEKTIDFGEPFPVEIVYQPVGVAAQSARPSTPQPGGCPCMDAIPVVHDEAVEPGEGSAAPVAQALPPELLDLAALLTEVGGVAGLRELLGSVRANQDAQRQALISEIASYRSAFGASDLAAMNEETLEKLAATLRPADYAGRGIAVNANSSEWEDYNG